jgi:hypothetical protein
VPGVLDLLAVTGTSLVDYLLPSTVRGLYRGHEEELIAGLERDCLARIGDVEFRLRAETRQRALAPTEALPPGVRGTSTSLYDEIRRVIEEARNEPNPQAAKKRILVLLCYKLIRETET